MLKIQPLSNYFMPKHYLVLFFHSLPLLALGIFNFDYFGASHPRTRKWSGLAHIFISLATEFQPGNTCKVFDKYANYSFFSPQAIRKF